MEYMKKSLSLTGRGPLSSHHQRCSTYLGIATTWFRILKDAWHPRTYPPLKSTTCSDLYIYRCVLSLIVSELHFDDKQIYKVYSVPSCIQPLRHMWWRHLQRIATQTKNLGLEALGLFDVKFNYAALHSQVEQTLEISADTPKWVSKWDHIFLHVPCLKSKCIGVASIGHTAKRPSLISQGTFGSIK